MNTVAAIVLFGSGVLAGLFGPAMLRQARDYLNRLLL